MQIALSEQGNPVLPFVQTCAGRTLDLAGKAEEPHPLQLIPARWRAFTDPFTTFVDDLAATESASDPDGKALIESLRRVIYDATEIFDCYASMLPDRVKPGSKAERDALNEYRSSAKRLRAFAALLCNRCKHASAQLQFLWARSTVNGVTGGRLLVSVYRDGTALLRDDQIHNGKMAGIGLVRLAQELAHNLLRIDRAAAALIRSLADRGVPALPEVQAEVPLGAALQRLASLQASRHSDESALHYGLRFADQTLELARVSAVDLGPAVRMRATLTHHLPTTSYSVA
ncbi:MAG: hypothetical protein V4472_12800 [Pseudomonadota bacterium]